MINNATFRKTMENVNTKLGQKSKKIILIKIFQNDE